MSAGAPFAEVMLALEAISPLALAEAWDNVGLLVPPSPSDRVVESALFAIDVTEPVMGEAARLGVDLVVGYHPILFKGVTRFVEASPQHRALLDAIRRGIAIFSPHTALDAAPDGMNDWLASAVGPGRTRPLSPCRVEIPGAGVGRLVELDEPRLLDDVIAAVKARLGLAHVRIARAPHHVRGALVRSAAVCVGAGGSVFEGLGDVDVLVTGEMRHHDVLARVGRGTSVILAEHSNSERGYLPRYAERLGRAVHGRVRCHVSTEDVEPLVVG